MDSRVRVKITVGILALAVGFAGFLYFMSGIFGLINVTYMDFRPAIAGIAGIGLCLMGIGLLATIKKRKG